MGLGFRLFIRPIIALQDSENAHARSVRSLRIFGNNPITRPFLSMIYKSRKKLPINVFDIDYEHPFGLAAGMDKKGEAINGWQSIGLSFAEIGGVTMLEQSGNPKPRMFRSTKHKALVNRMGFNNPGSKNMQNTLNLHYEKYGKPKIPVWVNLGKSKLTDNKDAHADYSTTLKRLWNYTDLFVINVSSPNTPNLRDLQGEEELKKIISSCVDVNIEEAGDIEKKFTENVLKDISKKVEESTIMSSNVLDDKDKTQYIRSELPKLNRKLASDVKDSTVSGNNAKWYYRKLGNTTRSDMVYGVGGRIDGFSNGQLVEVKNRVRRIPDNLPRYDMIQIQTYLHILKLPQCVVMQRLKNQKDVSSTLDVTAWNVQEWNARVASRLQIFSNFVDEITNLDSDGEIDVVTRMELLESLSRRENSSESLTRDVFVRFFERRINDFETRRAEEEGGSDFSGGILVN